MVGHVGCLDYPWISIIISLSYINVPLWWYGWKKFWNTLILDDENPINNMINHLPTGAGFLPSTVWYSIPISADPSRWQGGRVREDITSVKCGRTVDCWSPAWSALQLHCVLVWPGQGFGSLKARIWRSCVLSVQKATKAGRRAGAPFNSMVLRRCDTSFYWRSDGHNLELVSIVASESNVGQEQLQTKGTFQPSAARSFGLATPTFFGGRTAPSYIYIYICIYIYIPHSSRFFLEDVIPFRLPSSCQQHAAFPTPSRGRVHPAVAQPAVDDGVVWHRAHPLRSRRRLWGDGVGGWVHDNDKSL